MNDIILMESKHSISWCRGRAGIFQKRGGGANIYFKKLIRIWSALFSLQNSKVSKFFKSLHQQCVIVNLGTKVIPLGFKGGGGHFVSRKSLRSCFTTHFMKNWNWSSRDNIIHHSYQLFGPTSRTTRFRTRLLDEVSQYDNILVTTTT